GPRRLTKARRLSGRGTPPWGRAPPRGSPLRSSPRTKENAAMKNACLLALGLAAVALVPQATARQTRAMHPAPVVNQAELRRLLHQMDFPRDETWKWQRLMFRPTTPYSGSVRRIQSVAYRTWVRNLWRHRAVVARRRAQNPPHKHQWMCIHHYE